MKTKESNCNCGNGETIVMACSGASDLGRLTDLSARSLRDNNDCKMSCLALVGAGIEKSIESFKSSKLVVIDGCPIDCGKLIMNRNGLDNYDHVRLTDLGFVKGETEISEKTMSIVSERVLEAIN